MGEIRSTIDLMMERTAGMVLSDKEKEDYRREEFRKRARGLKMKLLDAPSGAESLLETLENEPEEDRNLLEKMLWEEFVQSLSPDRAGVKTLDVMARLPQARGKQELLEKLKTRLKHALKNKMNHHKTMLAREKKKLASFGISGTAVVPKIPKGKDENEELLAELESIKSELNLL